MSKFIRLLVWAALLPLSDQYGNTAKNIIIQKANATSNPNYLFYNISLRETGNLEVTIDVWVPITNLHVISDVSVRFLDVPYAKMHHLFNSSLDVCAFLEDPTQITIGKFIYDAIRSNPHNHVPTKCPIEVGQYYNRNFRMNGTLLPQAIPNLAFNLRYELYEFLPQREWVATVVYEGMADNRKIRNRKRD